VRAADTAAAIVAAENRRMVAEAELQAAIAEVDRLKQVADDADGD
jgi:hypothetical protein